MCDLRHFCGSGLARCGPQMSRREPAMRKLVVLLGAGLTAASLIAAGPAVAAGGGHGSPPGHVSPGGSAAPPAGIGGREATFHVPGWLSSSSNDNANPGYFGDGAH
jgi:hypothetical protein